MWTMLVVCLRCTIHGAPIYCVCWLVKDCICAGHWFVVAIVAVVAFFLSVCLSFFHNSFVSRNQKCSYKFCSNKAQWLVFNLVLFFRFFFHSCFWSSVGVDIVRAFSYNVGRMKFYIKSRIIWHTERVTATKASKTVWYQFNWKWFQIPFFHVWTTNNTIVPKRKFLRHWTLDFFDSVFQRISSFPKLTFLFRLLCLDNTFICKPHTHIHTRAFSFSLVISLAEICSIINTFTCEQLLIIFYDAFVMLS